MKPFKWILLTYVFFGCDPEYCNDYLLQNATHNDIELSFYGEEKTQVFIEKGRQIMQSSHCGMGKSYLTFELTDSIQIRVNDEVQKTFYPDDQGKSIYHTQDINSWKPVEKSAYYTKYIYKINDEDLN